MIRIVVMSSDEHIFISEPNTMANKDLQELFKDSVSEDLSTDTVHIIDDYIYYLDSDNNAMCIHGFDNKKLDDEQKSKLGTLCKRFLDEKLPKVIDESKNKGVDSEEVCRSFMISSLEAILEKTGFPQFEGSGIGENSLNYVKNRLISGCISIIGLLIMLVIGCSMLGK